MILFDVIITIEGKEIEIEITMESVLRVGRRD